MGLTMIAIKDLKKTYVMGKVHVHALKGITSEVDKGEFLAVMGASGSGKSTLLHQMGLLDIPTSGELIINQINVLELSEKDKTLFRLNQLGYVFQEYAILSELTVLENVYLPLLMMGIKKNGIRFKSKGNWHYFKSKSNTTSRLVIIPRLTSFSSFTPHRN